MVMSRVSWRKERQAPDFGVANTVVSHLSYPHHPTESALFIVALAMLMLAIVVVRLSDHAAANRLD
jgi:hypothetical protein